MKKIQLSFLAFLFPISFLFSQSVDFDHYQILQSTGKLPLDLSNSLQEDLTDLDKQVDSKKSKRTKKDEKDFIIKSAYSLDKLLRSGVVIFNDPIGAYLTKVLKGVLSANGIEEDIDVYFIRSEEVNAYAMDRNFIFLTAGLLAQVTSEAQLAMVLSHEFIHYQKKHNRTGFIENKALVRDYKSYKTSATDARFLMASFSRELEFEADQEGFKLYSNSNYNYDAALEAFDVLRYSYLPFEEIPYEKNFLASADMKFPEEYFLPKVTPIEYNILEKEDDNDEKFSSHPNIEKRKVAIQDLKVGKDNTGRKDFIVSENDFYNYRKIARFELCRLYLLEKRFEDAFYSAYILLQDDPNSIYLKKIILKSLYGLSKYCNANKFSSVHEGYKKKEGESQQVNFFLDKLTKKELNMVAIHYAWGLHLADREDGDINYILNDLTYDACDYNGLTPYSLKTEHPDTNTILAIQSDSLKNTDTTTTNTKTNKYDKIKVVSDSEKGTKTTKKKSNGFIDYAFVSYLKDPEFKKLIKDQYEKFEDDEQKKEDAIKNKSKRKVHQYSDDEIDENRNIEGMLVLNPVILKIDMRKDVNKMYNASQTKRKELINNFTKLNTKAGIKTTMLTTEDITEDDADFLNHVSIFNNAMYEMLSLPGKVNMLPTDNLDLKNLSEKYNTPYLANIGVLTYVDKKYGVALAVLMGVVTMGFLLPYTIYVLARPNVSTLVYMNVYDVDQNKFVFSEVTEIKSGGTQDVMISTLYDMVVRMKKNK